MTNFANFFAPIALPTNEGTGYFNQPGNDVWTVHDYFAPQFATARTAYEAELKREQIETED